MSVPEAAYPEEELRKYHLSTPATHSHVVKVARRYKVSGDSRDTPTRVRRHISERSWTLRNWYRHLHWRNLFVVVVVPLAGLAVGLAVRPPLGRATAYFALLDYTLTTLSINILYHRFWCHRALQIDSEPLLRVLLLLASGGGVTCARNWCSAHRSHHRHCDITDRDPHNIRKGFLFAHVGWMVLLFRPSVQQAIHAGRLDKFENDGGRDSFNDEISQWQAENYLSLFVSMGLLLPCVLCGWLFNDFWGGLVYAGFLKVFVVQQASFCVNSVAHLVGTQPYNSSKSPRNNLLVNLVTLGEGNLNFHQEFPMDYRNSDSWCAWDPTRWAIRLLQAFGAVSNLRCASQSSIDKSLVQEQQRLLDNMRSELNWGIPIDRLPVFTPDQLRELAAASKDRYYVVVSGIIHDVTPFAKDHPGGLALIKAAHGKDATAAFDGAVYQHSNAARNLLATMRIGALGGSEKLFWKQQRMENKAVPLDSDTGGHRIVRSGSQATTSNSVIGGTADAA